MPVMDGYEMARAIRELEENQGGAIPIIACTANAMQSEAAACREAGMDDYLVKPVSLKELGRQLDKWLPIPGQAA